MTDTPTQINDEIIDSVAKRYTTPKSTLETWLQPPREETEAVQKCVELQEIQDKIGDKLAAAAEHDKYKLVNIEDGTIFWVDTYDKTGAYVHTDEGDTHYMSIEQIYNGFNIIKA